MSLIEITEVRKRFGDNEVLKGINLDVEAGEVIAIIGKSGSGKSTLLRCVNGLESIDDGSISVAGAQLLPDELHRLLQGARAGIVDARAGHADAICYCFPCVAIVTIFFVAGPIKLFKQTILC